MSPSRRSPRRGWLYGLAEALVQHGGDEFPGVVFLAVYDLLRADGMRGRDAFDVALRGCKLAVYLLAGVEQRAAARELGVSERTAKYDAQRLRRVVSSGVLSRPRASPALRLPRRPVDVVAARSARLGRRPE